MWQEFCSPNVVRFFLFVVAVIRLYFSLFVTELLRWDCLFLKWIFFWFGAIQKTPNVFPILIAFSQKGWSPFFFVGLRSNPKEDTANSSWSLLRQNRKIFLFFLEICSNLEFPTYPMSKKLSEFRYVAFNGSACKKILRNRLVTN